MSEEQRVFLEKMKKMKKMKNLRSKATTKN
jgi:hypothetical protein